jgi:hypothetical protein
MFELDHGRCLGESGISCHVRRLEAKVLLLDETAEDVRARI